MEALMNANAALEERYREGTKELTAAHTELRIENSLRRVFTMRLEQISGLHLKFSRMVHDHVFAVASQGNSRFRRQFQPNKRHSAPKLK